MLQKIPVVLLQALKTVSANALQIPYPFIPSLKMFPYWAEPSHFAHH